MGDLVVGDARGAPGVGALERSLKPELEIAADRSTLGIRIQRVSAPNPDPANVLPPQVLPSEPGEGIEAAGAPQILIADDHNDSLRLTCRQVTGWGYQALAATNGDDAMTLLDGAPPPDLAVLDWSMPGLSGPEICRRVRQRQSLQYIILLTGYGGREEKLEGLLAGADDYLVKPFDAAELHVRIQVGLRIVSLQRALAARVAELDRIALALREELAEKESLLEALSTSQGEIAALQEGLVVVCAWTKRIKHEGEWISMDEFLIKHLGLKLTHGISDEAAAEILKGIEARRKTPA